MQDEDKGTRTGTDGKREKLREVEERERRMRKW